MVSRRLREELIGSSTSTSSTLSAGSARSTKTSYHYGQWYVVPETWPDLVLRTLIRTAS
jgi:hypothetical protein